MATPAFWRASTVNRQAEKASLKGSDLPSGTAFEARFQILTCSTAHCGHGIMVAIMEACKDDNIFTMTSFLLPVELAYLSFACRRFGGKSIRESPRNNKEQQRLKGGWPWSLMEEASRRQVSAVKNDVDNPWRDSDLLSIRGQESWMAVHQRLHLLRSSLAFSRIIGGAMGYHASSGDIRHVQGRRKEGVGFSVALCQEVMTCGRHHAEFDVTNGGEIYVGIIRPIHCWSKRKIKHEEFRNFCRKQKGMDYNGEIHWYYDLQCNNLKEGDILSMLLDLEKGSLTVCKNGVRRLSVQGGLTGHYCWCVTTQKNGANNNKPSIRIRKVLLPE